MRQHSLSAAFPAMAPADLAALTEDVAQHGLRHPVIVYEGQVLDGWHRYSACVAAGITPTTVELPADEDPVAYVLSCNLSRRHLTASQRAAAIVACSEWKPEGKPRVGANSAPSAELMASRVDVSTRTVEYAKAAQRAGIGEAVRDGKVSAKRAAEIAKLPAEEREEALEAPSQRKTAPVETEKDTGEEPGRLDDLLAEYEALSKIVAADDRVAEAWAEVKEWQAKHADLERLYDGQRAELAAAVKEAKRWKRRAEAAESRAEAAEKAVKS